MGRKSDGHNKGYWLRKGRGWYVTEAGQPVPLADEAGNHIKAADTPKDALERAYARYLLGIQERAKREAIGAGAIVYRVCLDYLDHAKAENRDSTYTKRGEFLFDFVYGLPCRFWDYGGKREPPKPNDEDYIHDGFGKREVMSLIPLDVQKWLDAHPDWGKGTRRMAIQSVKRAFNYAKEMGVIPANPIRGMKVPTGGKRVTYFTDEQEAAIYEVAPKPLALCVKVCIRTGVRYGSEFARLTAKHVEDRPDVMIWRFSAKEHKTGGRTGKERVIFVAPEIAKIVRPLMKRFPDGPLFRNSVGTPWNQEALGRAFLRVKDTLAEQGRPLDKDACLYSCRHTFAKRMLGGYWSGKPVTLEILAGLMGNTRQVAWECYGKWCGSYNAPLIEAVNGTGRA